MPDDWPKMKDSDLPVPDEVDLNVAGQGFGKPPSIPPILRRLPPVLLCLHILLFDLSNAYYCYDVGNLAAGDYARNRVLILSSLPGDVASNSGFYSRKVWKGSDVIYVLSFCRGDSSNNTCLKCISSAAEELRGKCSKRKAAYSWGIEDPPRSIRYSDSPMYGVKQTFPTLKLYRIGNIPMDQDQFDRI
ncbi:cysteine-rich receptor-like protein kinase 22 [Eucalyptus grandis]|uniref:cysteine-rich receptor-like protein kinase 22 n=1 Tax=Eucalyptus grandis TaxID=71139 RepID=UPI00192EA962|nr:cysteine-rich receptor-like protein kinase 22 [Eucalyptus grandis]